MIQKHRVGLQDIICPANCLVLPESSYPMLNYVASFLELDRTRKLIFVLINKLLSTIK